MGTCHFLEYLFWADFRFMGVIFNILWIVRCHFVLYPDLWANFWKLLFYFIFRALCKTLSRDYRQISYLILNQLKRINELLFPLNSAYNFLTTDNFHWLFQEGREVDVLVVDGFLIWRRFQQSSTKIKTSIFDILIIKL